MKKWILLTCSILVIQSKVIAQHYRLAMDFTIKEKNDSIQALYIGRLYFDINKNQLIFDLTFPNKEKWVFTDSFFVVVSKEHKVKRKVSSKNIGESNVFRLILNNSLNTFGLTNAPYKLSKTKLEQGFTVLSYKPIQNAKALGTIDLAYKFKLLQSVIIYLPKSDKVFMKQYFSQYSKIKDLQIPLEYYQISYINNKEVIKKFTFKNVNIDEKGNDGKYIINF